MPIGLYMDVHISRAVVIALRMRGIDVLASYDDRARTLTDAKLLDKATLLRRLLYSQDDDLLKEARSRIEAGIPFTVVSILISSILQLADVLTIWKLLQKHLNRKI